MDSPQCIDLSNYYDIVNEEEDEEHVNSTQSVEVDDENTTASIEERDLEENITASIEECSTECEEDIIVDPISPDSPIGQIPNIIFIVPYRDREQHYRFFSIHMKVILEDYPEGSYQIIYVHQKDERSFNRGAMKNIGFLYAKTKYPEDYKNITFVFNDIDTMPYTKDFLDYKTVKGIIKHFYGFTFTLGGIVSINGQDFEEMNGYPNYWSWGFEDNALQKRAQRLGIQIDRSKFYPIMDKNIMQLKDGLQRIVNRGEFDRYINEISYSTNNEGLVNLSNVNYSYDASTGFIDVNTFSTGIDENPALSKIHDIRNDPRPFKLPNTRRGSSFGMKFTM